MSARRKRAAPRQASSIAIGVFALAATAFALVLAGCGASAKPHHAAPPQPSQADRMKAVVRAWTANLDGEDNAAEARLFSLPALISLMEGPYGCWCLTPAEVAQFHAQLLCSVKIVSIEVRGRYATAVFSRGGDRETSKCDAPPGALTGVRFTIVRGKITVLQQVWWKPPGRPAIPATTRSPSCMGAFQIVRSAFARCEWAVYASPPDNTDRFLVDMTRHFTDEDGDYDQ